MTSQQSALEHHRKGLPKPSQGASKGLPITVLPYHGPATWTDIDIGRRYVLLGYPMPSAIIVPSRHVDSTRTRELSTPETVDQAFAIIASGPKKSGKRYGAKLAECESYMLAGDIVSVAKAYQLARSCGCEHGRQSRTSRRGQVDRGRGPRAQAIVDRAERFVAVEASLVRGTTPAIERANIRAAWPTRRDGQQPPTHSTHPPGSPEHTRVSGIFSAVEVEGEWYARVTDYQASTTERKFRATRALRESCGIHPAKAMPKSYVSATVQAYTTPRGNLKAGIPDVVAADALGLATTRVILTWRKNHEIEGADCRAKRDKRTRTQLTDEPTQNNA